jgi:hypothetical protein
MDKELSDDDKELIREIFEEEVVPKLKHLHARIGNLNCDFAGERFKHWTMQFRDRGSDFDIIDFEYDEDGTGIDLDV